MEPQIKNSLVLIMSIFLIITVAIAGLFYFQIKKPSKYQTQPTSLTSPSPIIAPMLTVTPDPTANWKTYTNTETGLKFSIKYPEQLYVEELTTSLDPEKSEEVDFFTIVFNLEKFRDSPTNDIPRIGIQIRSGGVSLEKWISKNFAKSNIKNKRNVKVAGVEGMRFSAEDSQGRLTENVLISYRSYILYFYIFNAQSEDLEPTFNPMLSTFKFLDQNIVSDNCVGEKDSILAVVSTFENLQKNKNAKGVLALFTPPQSPKDISNYQNLSSEDAQVSPRLYNNVSTNYNTLSYKVTQPPTKLSGELCNVTAEEQRSNYGGPTNPQYLPAQTEEFVLILTKLDGKWKIDQYQSKDPKIKKGKYSGFLMEY